MTGDGMVQVITPACPWCHRASVVVVPEDQHARWRAGAFVQDAFPGMSAGTRELLITGTHPACWDAMLPPEDDE